MFIDLPKFIELKYGSCGLTEQATIESLDREIAKVKIDSNWWRPMTESISNLKDEPDSEWRWRDLVSRAQNKPFFRARCVKSVNGEIQAEERARALLVERGLIDG